MINKKNILIAVLAIIVFSAALGFIFIRVADADIGYNLREKSRIEQSDGLDVVTYELYMTITGTTTVNHVEGYLELQEYTLVDFEPQEEFQIVDWDEFSLSYNLTSNKKYTASDATNGEIVFATITVKETGGTPCHIYFYPQVTSTVNTNDVSITKRAISQIGGNLITEVNEDDTFYYEVTLTNNSDITTDEVTLTDPIPDEFTLNSNYVTTNYDECSVSNNSITCSVGKMSPGATKTYYFPVTVTSEASGNIKNTATITINDITKSAQANVVVLYSNITITKEASKKQIRPGETFYYTITVKNTGTGSSKPITITDTLDSDLSFISSTPTHNAGSTYSWTISSLASGESKEITIEVRLNSNTTKTNISNTATACEEDKTPCQNTTITTPVVDSNITITKTANTNQVRIGDTFTYNITVTNNGNADSYSIVVTDTLDERLNLISADVGSTYINGNTFTYTIDSLKANGGSKTFTLTAQVLSTANVNDTINNIATATENGKPSVKDDTDITIYDSNTTLTKSVSKSIVNIGEEFYYTITVTNTSAYKTKELTLTDVIPSGINIISAPSSSNINGNTITYNIGVLEGGESKTYRINVSANSNLTDNTTLRNIATLTEVGKEDLEDYADVTIVKPNISITKKASKTSVKPGEEFTYTITITNTGKGTANNLTLTDEIDSRLTIIDGDEGTINNQTITWNITSLNSNASLTYTIRVKVNEGVSLGTIIPNTAVVTFNNEQLTDDDDVTVTSSNITLNKVASIDEVRSGDFLYYNITVSNTGNSAETNLTIKDTISDKLNIINVKTPTGVTYEQNNQNLTFNIASINPNETFTITIYVEVTSNVSANEIIPNTAILTYSDKELTSSDDIVVIDSNLSVIKTVSKDKVALNEEYTYTINIINNGAAPATNVTVIDTFDSDIEIVNSNGGTINNNTITWNIDRLEPRSKVTYVITAKVSKTNKTSLLNAVVVKEPNKPDITDEVEVLVGNPALEISKIANVTETTPGGEYEYYITIKNNSDYDAQNITLTDVFDDRLIIIDNDGGIINNNEITWNFNLTANNSIIFTVKVKVIDNITNDTIPNIATITYNDEEIPSEEVIVIITDEIENPQTGSIIKYMLITTGIIISGFSIIYVKKHKKLFKI